MASITTLASTENWTDSRIIINDNFTNLNVDLVAAEWDISQLQTDVNTVESDITTLQNTRALKAGDTFTGQVKLAKGADIASASTVDLWAATGNYVDITWVVTITSLGTATAWTQVKARFVDALILTHNATSLILPTGANITTVANDTAEFVSLGSGNWRCTNYLRATGVALGAVDITALTEDTVWDMDADFIIAYDAGATANKKQKPSVYKASDAEAIAWSSTTKWMTPKNVKDNYFAWLKQVNTYSFNSTGEVTATTLAIPANSLGTNWFIKIEWSANITASWGGSTWATVRIKYGGTTIVTLTAAGISAWTTEYSTFSAVISNSGGTSSQVGFWQMLSGSPTSASAEQNRGTLSIDSTSAQDLVITVQWAANITTSSLLTCITLLKN